MSRDEITPEEDRALQDCYESILHTISELAGRGRTNAMIVSVLGALLTETCSALSPEHRRNAGTTIGGDLMMLAMTADVPKEVKTCRTH